MKRLLPLVFSAFFLLIFVPAAQAQNSCMLLNWTASTISNAAYYNIYRNGVKVGQSSTNSYQDTGLNASTSYTYTVTVVNTFGVESPQSISATATTLSTPNCGTTAVLPAYDNLTANWVNAGLAKIGGIPNRTTVCATVNSTGVTPPASNDDAHAIQTAINNCATGDVVQLGAGTFQFDIGEGILINKGITVRGTGTCNNAGTPYCATVINIYNGQWNTYGANGGECTNSTTFPPNGTPGAYFACNQQAGGCYGICLEPIAGNHYDWGGCSIISNVNPTASNCGTTLTADAAQGASTVQVTSTANFTVGMWVMLDENPRTVSTANPIGNGQPNIYASPEFLNSSGSPVTFRLARPDGNCDYSFCGDVAQNSRLNQEIHLITAIGAGPCPGVNCTLTFDSPLTIAFRQSGSHDARVYWPGSDSGNISFLQQAGVENLTIERGFEPVTMWFCAYCWVKNLEIAYWNGGPNMEYSARPNWTGNYIHHCLDCANDGAEYPIAIDRATTEALVDNNITLYAGKGMVGRTSNSAVVAYNYQDKTSYAVGQSGIGAGFVDMGVNGTHNAGTHGFLFEGNWGDNCDGDETHGNSFYHVWFRNDCTGIRTSFVDPSTGQTVNDAACLGNGNGGTDGGCQTTGGGYQNGPLRAAGPMAFNYWYAFVGNVLGLAGVTTSANGWIYFDNAHEPSNELWMSGWTGSEWGSYPDANLGNNSAAYIFRNGNYDYVNGAVVDNAAGYSQSFPNSLYTITKPPYFSAGTSCTYPWPWVTPNGSSPLQTNSCGGSGLPAKARWDAGTPFVQP
jgi:hypothetical protein